MSSRAVVFKIRSADYHGCSFGICGSVVLGNRESDESTGARCSLFATPRDRTQYVIVAMIYSPSNLDANPLSFVYSRTEWGTYVGKLITCHMKERVQLIQSIIPPNNVRRNRKEAKRARWTNQHYMGMLYQSGDVVLLWGCAVV